MNYLYHLNREREKIQPKFKEQWEEAVQNVSRTPVYRKYFKLISIPTLYLQKKPHPRFFI